MDMAWSAVRSGHVFLRDVSYQRRDLELVQWSIIRVSTCGLLMMPGRRSGRGRLGEGGWVGTRDSLWRTTTPVGPRIGDRSDLKRTLLA